MRRQEARREERREEIFFSKNRHGGERGGRVTDRQCNSDAIEGEERALYGTKFHLQKKREKKKAASSSRNWIAEGNGRGGE